jgi:hypothetical protein
MTIIKTIANSKNWLRLYKYRPKIPEGGYNYSLFNYYADMLLSLVIVGLILFLISIEIWGQTYDSFIIIIGTGLIISNIYFMGFYKKRRKFVDQYYSLDLFEYNIKKEIWRYFIWDEEIPDLTKDTIEKFKKVLHFNGSHWTEADYKNEMYDIYRRYLSILAPALNEGLDSRKFFELKIRYSEKRRLADEET